MASSKERVNKLPVVRTLKIWLYLYTIFLYSTCDFQQCGILTSVDSDEPVQPPYKLRNSLCSVSRLILRRLAKAWIRLHMRRLIFDFAGRTLLEISCCSSFASVQSGQHLPRCIQDFCRGAFIPI